MACNNWFAAEFIFQWLKWRRCWAVEKAVKGSMTVKKRDESWKVV